MSVKKDIEYYVKILNTANTMERTDPYLCVNLLGKCAGLIENNEEEFLKVYPERKLDKLNLRTRLRNLKKKHGDMLEQGDDNLLNTTSFTSFISEASDRAKTLADQLKYKQAIIILDEGIKMAQGLGVLELGEILVDQKEMYLNEQKEYKRKIQLIKDLIKKVKRLEEEKKLKSIINESKKIIPLAIETQNEKIATKYEKKIDETEEEIVKIKKENLQLFELVKEAQDNGDFEEADEICKQIVFNAQRLEDIEIEEKYVSKRNQIQKEQELMESDLDTRLKTYISQCEDNQKEENYIAAINDCEKIIEIGKELSEKAKVKQFKERKEELKDLLQKTINSLEKERDSLISMIKKAENKEEYSAAVDLITRLLKILSSLENKEQYRHYTELQTKLQQKLSELQKEMREYLTKQNKKIEEYLSSNNTIKAIETCEHCVQYTHDKKAFELEKQYKRRWEELKERYEKEQNILQLKITQIKNEINQNIENEDTEAIIDNCNKLINLALTNDMHDLAEQYSKIKEKYMNKDLFEQEQKKIEQFKKTQKEKEEKLSDQKGKEKLKEKQKTQEKKEEEIEKDFIEERKKETQAQNIDTPYYKKFKNDQIIILGSGGGRYVARTQHRSTGGIIFQAHEHKVQMHIDPGPGAIRDINKYKINSVDTEYIILTHMHTDHCMSIPIIIESAQLDLKFTNCSGTLVAPRDYLLYLDPYYKELLEKIVEVDINQRFVLEKDIKIQRVTPTKHGNVDNFGYIFEIGKKSDPYYYTIAFTSDTDMFSGYMHAYKGVDILIANVLRPDSKKCKGHLTVNEFIPLLKFINPKICVLTHFGGFMDSPEIGNQVPNQIKKIQRAVGKNIVVIGAEDGLLVRFSKVLQQRHEEKSTGLRMA